MLSQDSYRTLSDAHLLTLIKQDDEKAFEAIYDKYWLLILNTANKRLKDRQNSMDVVQNVFIGLWARRNKTNIENLQGYLQQATRFQVYKMAAKLPLNSSFLNLVDDITSLSFGADEPVREKEMAEFLKRWIETLSPRSRKIFLLHLEDNLSTKEIAEQLDISRKTVQNNLGITFNAIEKKILPLIVLAVLLQEILGE